jgi:protein gp37
MEKLLYQWPPPNYWAGVSVENQITANERIPLLIRTPAAKRFVSFEPAIGWVEFYREIFDLDLVIVGAETGPGKRPMDLDWARSVRDQCAAAGVPFWFKKDSYGNETLDGVTHHPEFWR